MKINNLKIIFVFRFKFQLENNDPLFLVFRLLMILVKSVKNYPFYRKIQNQSHNFGIEFRTINQFSTIKCRYPFYVAYFVAPHYLLYNNHFLLTINKSKIIGNGNYMLHINTTFIWVSQITRGFIPEQELMRTMQSELQ